MKTEDLLMLDLRKEENWETIKKALCKIKPLARYADHEKVPQESLEKVMDVLCRKYEVEIQYIMPSHIPNEIMWWSLSIKRTDNNKWLGSVFGHTMYELMCKTAIALYSNVKTKGIPERKNIKGKGETDSE